MKRRVLLTGFGLFLLYSTQVLGETTIQNTRPSVYQNNQVFDIGKVLDNKPIEPPILIAEASQQDSTIESDFENADAFIDIEDALKSKQFVHRAILSTAIQDTSRFRLGRPYFNHLMGFNAILQGGNPYAVRWMKFVSGMQGFSGGYITEMGHAVELGVDLSAVGSVYGGYRYFYQPENYSLWPFFGGGLGYEIRALSIADGPPEAVLYAGKKEMIFGTVGLLVPLVDMGLKVEIRVTFYGKDRVVLTQGIGAILFL